VERKVRELFNLEIDDVPVQDKKAAEGAKAEKADKK
jgi:hypothetical protein